MTIAACLSSKPLFVSPMDRRDEARRYVKKQNRRCIATHCASSARERFATANSDLLTDSTAYTECLAIRKEGPSRVRAFCDEASEL